MVWPLFHKILKNMPKHQVIMNRTYKNVVRISASGKIDLKPAGLSYTF